MASQKIKVSVIILSWNTKRLLSDCLKSLGNNPAQEVIVIDNGSEDGSPEMVKKHFPWAKLVQNKKNLGFGAANNQGIRMARANQILLLNSDTIVQKDAVAKLADFLIQRPLEVGVVGPKLLNKDGTDQPSVGPFPNLGVTLVMLFAERWLGGRLVRYSPNKEKVVDWVMGAALMFRKEVVAKAGLMDESIFMYMDEVEWCYRIKKVSFKVLFYPGAKITHLGGASSKTGRKDPIVNIYRGLSYFYKKHYPSWQFPLLQLMLKLKAAVALTVGWLTKNEYLIETYREAIKIK